MTGSKSKYKFSLNRPNRVNNQLYLIRWELKIFQNTSQRLCE